MLGTASRTQVATLLKRVADQDIAGVMDTSEEIYQAGVDFNDVLRELIALLHQVALRQALPKAELPPQFEEADVATLATALKPEDTQLYYQFALAAKRDMAVVSDYKAAFEMTMLKMVCFVPFYSESVSQPAQKQTRTTTSTPTPKVSARTKKSAIPESETPTDAVAEVSQTNKNTQNSDNSSVQHKNLLDCKSIDDWRHYVEASGLMGAARAICLNSSIAIESDNQATIKVPPDIKDLCTEDIKAEILNKLKQLNGTDIGLTFQYATPEATPISEDEKINRQKQHDAEMSIQEDPNVQALQKKLGAQVISNTTKPIEPKRN